MKIGIFTECYKPIVNGVVHSIEATRRGLIKLGHEVFIFSPNYPEKIEEKNLIRCPSIKFPGESGYQYTLPFTTKIKKIIKILDIIHTHHPFIMGRRAAISAKRYHIPLVFTNHTQYEQYSHYIPIARSAVKRSIRHFVKKFAQKCDLIVAPAEGIKHKLLEYRVTRPIEVVPNGIDLAKFQISQKDFLQTKYHLNKNWLVFVYSGRIAQEKNLEFLIKAFAQANQKNPESYLILIGGGPEKEKYHQQIKELNLESKVIITGFLPYQDIPKCLASADCFVSASKSEVHPMTVIEAEAAGLPSVVFDVFGTGEIIENGKNGLKTKKDNLFEFARAIIKIIKNKDLRQKLGATAAIDCQKYSYLETSKLMITAYQKAQAEYHKRSKLISKT